MDKYDIGTGFGHYGIAVEDVSVKSQFILFEFQLCANVHQNEGR